mgnify:CR=1 FL=1|jgi:maleylpyruvate isomerase
MSGATALTPMVLHGFFRSSASWRVRIALNIKRLDYQQETYHLRSGEQRSDGFLALNPQGLVPALEIGDTVFTQSLAICEYLDEMAPEPPLLSSDPVKRARIRAFSQAIACDIHPVQNLKILARLGACGLDQSAVSEWAGEIIGEGLTACAALLPIHSGRFCFGDQPTLADICLIPQMANARRFGAVLTSPRLVQIEENCLALPAFERALPVNQPDAE